MHLRTTVTLAFALVLSSAVSAHAQLTDTVREETLESPRGIGMGTGVRASAVSTSALAYNAAALPNARVYHIEGIADYVPDFGRWALGAAVIDSITSPLAAGLSFRGLLGDGESQYDGIDGRLSLGFPLADAIAIGLSGRYLNFSPTDQDGPDAEALRAKGFTLDAAINVTPTAGLHFAALGYNLLDLSSPLTPVLVGGSAAYTIDSALTLGGDALVDLTTFDDPAVIVGGGAEYLSGGVVPLRLGYRFDDGRDRHSVSGSVGFVDQQFGVDIALRQDVAGGSETRLLLGLRYHVQ